MPGKVYVSENFLLSVLGFNVHNVVAVKVYDLFGNRVVHHFVALVDEDEEEVESGHNGRRQHHVLLQRLATLVTTAYWVSSS